MTFKLKEKWENQNEKWENTQSIIKKTPDFSNWSVDRPNEKIWKNTTINRNGAISVETLNKDHFIEFVRELGKIKWADKDSIIEGIHPGIYNVLKNKEGVVDEVVRWYQEYSYRYDVNGNGLGNDIKIKKYIINECIEHWVELYDLYQNADQNGKNSLINNTFSQLVSHLSVEKGIWERGELDNQYPGLFDILNKNYCSKGLLPQIMIWNDYLIIPEKISVEDKEKLSYILDSINAPSEVFSSFASNPNLKGCESKFYEDIKGSFSKLREKEQYLERTIEGTSLTLIVFLFVIGAIGVILRYLIWRSLSVEDIMVMGELWVIGFTSIILVTTYVWGKKKEFNRKGKTYVVWGESDNRESYIKTIYMENNLTSFVLIWFILTTLFLSITFRSPETILKNLHWAFGFIIYLYMHAKRFVPTYIRYPFPIAYYLIIGVGFGVIDVIWIQLPIINLYIGISLPVIWLFIAIYIQKLQLKYWSKRNENMEKIYECMGKLFGCWLTEGPHPPLFRADIDYKDYEITLRSMNLTPDRTEKGKWIRGDDWSIKLFKESKPP